MVVLDWHTKKVVGHYAGLQARAWHWLVALNRATNRQFPDGVRDRALNLMADNGCQPTSLAFMRACAAMGIRQAFTSYNNPKGNADTERFLRTLKEELVWLRESTSPDVFFQAFDRWIVEYNNSYLHSGMCYRSPVAFEPNISATHYLSRCLLNREQYTGKARGVHSSWLEGLRFPLPAAQVGAPGKERSGCHLAMPVWRRMPR